MGSLKGLDGQRLYVDANVLIYAVEGLPEWAQPAQAILSAVDVGRCTVVTSELSLAECLVKPHADGRSDIAQVYTALIQSAGGFTTVPVTREVLVQAAIVRAKSKLKLPDAIHIATAQQVSCTAFVTNDAHLRTAPGVNFVSLAAISA